MAVRICYRVSTKDGDGNPYEFGISVEQDGAKLKEGVTYDQLVQHIDKQIIIDALYLTGKVTPDQLTAITPEEYDREFDGGDDTEDEDA